MDNSVEQRLARIEAHLFGKADQATVQELRDYVVPLEHATLTREEVAARCVDAASVKGYDKNGGYWGSLREDSAFFLANGYGLEFLFHYHDCQATRPNTLTTLEAFEEYCGVQRQPTYNARFGFIGERQFLKLPDGTELYFSGQTSAWQKDIIIGEAATHTLTKVEQHTVGKFYLLKDTEVTTPNNWRFYALCVADGLFIQPYLTTSNIVAVQGCGTGWVSHLEVTPL